MTLLHDYHLELLCLGVGLTGLLLLSRRVPFTLAFVIVVLRLGTSYLYFSDIYGEKYYLLDDLVYLEKATLYLRAGFLPWEAFTNPEAAQALERIAQSRHTLYYVWTAMGLTLFGDHYYSPVLLNVLLTFVTAVVFARGLELMGAGPRFRSLAVAYQSLHMNYFSWVALMNCKEALVEFLLITMVVSIMACMIRRQVWPVLWIILAGSALLSLRLYVPVLVTAGGTMSALMVLRGPQKLILVSLLLGAVLVLGQRLSGDAHWMAWSGIGSGSVRFLLTPRPWGIESEYRFMVLAAIQQWVMMLPMLLGGSILWRRQPRSRVFLCTLMVFILFYGMWPEHQGPRHRVQLSSLMSLAEFQFVWLMLNVKELQRHSALPRRPVAVPKQNCAVGMS